VCVENGNQEGMSCTNLSTMFDDSCNLVPFKSRKDK
jgi:hypothetical protein